MTWPLYARPEVGTANVGPGAGHRRKHGGGPESTGMCRSVVWDRSAGGEHEEGGGDGLGQHLLAPQRAWRNRRPSPARRRRHGGRAPAAGEDAGAADDATGVDAVDADAVRAEFGGQLVGWSALVAE